METFEKPLDLKLCASAEDFSRDHPVKPSIPSNFPHPSHSTTYLFLPHFADYFRQIATLKVCWEKYAGSGS
jgi:hypothetical protein